MKSVATIGGGCYWCLEAYYSLVNGIITVTSGYSGGNIDHPIAERVYQGDTGHAEVVQIEFDSDSISYRELLEIFFVMHDPTTLNRQGYDKGEWYRSVIFWHDSSQQKIAQDMIGGYAKTIWDNPIVTQLQPFERFWPAEASMQKFYEKNPSYGYCQMIIDPKIQKLRQKFAAKLRA